MKAAANVSVTLPGGNELEARTWAWSAEDDLAWVAFDIDEVPGNLALADKNVVPGDLVAGIGVPLGGKKTVERGRLVEYRPPFERSSSFTDVMLASAETLPDGSGGAIINTYGRVVGVMFAMDFERNLTMAISSSRLRAFLTDLPGVRAPRSC